MEHCQKMTWFVASDSDQRAILLPQVSTSHGSSQTQYFVTKAHVSFQKQGKTPFL